MKRHVADMLIAITVGFPTQVHLDVLLFSFSNFVRS